MSESKRRGRPTIDPDGRPAEPVYVRITQRDYEAACKAAATRRESIQELIRRSLSRELKQV